MERSTITFRLAQAEDQEAVTQLMIDLSSELPITEVSHEVIRHNVAAMYSLPNVCAFVAEKDNEIIGGIGFILGTELWSSRVIAYEAFWYVKPQHRGSVGMGLLNYVETNLKCDIVDLGVYNPRLQQLLSKKGYRYEKAIMTKEL